RAGDQPQDRRAQPALPLDSSRTRSLPGGRDSPSPATGECSLIAHAPDLLDQRRRRAELPRALADAPEHVLLEREPLAARRAGVEVRANLRQLRLAQLAVKVVIQPFHDLIAVEHRTHLHRNRRNTQPPCMPSGWRLAGVAELDAGGTSPCRPAYS